MADKKFSEFLNGNQMQIGDQVVGLRSGANYRFDFPGDGIKDGNGNYLFQYATAGAAAANYLKLVSSTPSQPVQLTADGADADVTIEIVPKAAGNLILDGLTWPISDGAANQAIITDGAGNLDWGTVPIVSTPTTDNAIARYNGTGGALQNSGVIIDDSDGVSGITQLSVDNLRLDGNALTSTNSNGNITITANGTGSVIANSVTITSTSEVSGVTKLTVDNLRLDGNTIVSTNSAGNISITPDTTGDLILDGLKWPQADGTSGQAITTNGTGQLGWSTVSTVTTPTTDNAIARFDGTGGALQNSLVTISDLGEIAGATKLTVDNIVVDGAAVQHLGDLTNQIVFGSATQSFEAAGSSILDISSSGVRMGAANARVTTILTDSTMAGAADTNLYTGLAIKTYVDAVATGLNIQAACVAGSTTALTVTYNNNGTGVGATLTNAGALAAISLDGVSPTVGQRVLIKNQASSLQNGIYTVTTVGSGAVAWVLTRATDFDSPSEIQPGDLVVLTGGTTQSNSSWLQTATVTTVGTDPITFIQFSASIPVSLANGGTGASLTASNGGIFYSTGSAGAILSGTATANQILMSGSSAAPSWSTATYPSTATSAGKILRADGTNWAASTATYPNTATSTGTILRADGTNWTATTAAYPNTATSTGTILRADGTNWVASTATYPNTATSTGTILRANGTNWTATTATYPTTTTVSQILYSSSANVIGGITTANNGTLITSAGGVPSISSTLPSAVQTNITSLGTIGNNPTFSSGLGFGGGSNSLNYYTENGSWTPVFTFATPGTLSVVYTIQTGLYSRAGNIVFVEGQLSFTPTLGTASGNMRVTGFPFAFGSNAMSLGISQQNAVPTFTGGRTYSWILGSSGNTFAQWVTAGSALGSTNMNTANFTSGAATQFNFSGVYLV